MEKKINLDELTINSIRMLGVQAVNQAKSGHPGIVLGAAPMAYALFKDHLQFNPNNPKWFNRDRFVLSAGHGSALLYSVLHHSGYKMTIENLKDFRKLDSITPGHPEYDLPLGVEVATGPLGQGIANAVGMALAESFLAGKYNNGTNLIDHYTYVLCGDGDLQEGIAQEALSVAGHYALSKLILLYDSNDVQLDSATNKVISENIQMRFEALQWNHILVQEGNDFTKISAAIAQAKTSDKPTLIEVKTVIGLGATKQGTSAVHGAPLMQDITTVKKFYNWEYEDFTVPTEVIDSFTKTKVVKGAELEANWLKVVEDYKVKNNNTYQEIAKAIQGEVFPDQEELLKKIDWKSIITTTPQATRVSSGNVLKLLSDALPTLFGGSADLAGSTKAFVTDADYTAKNRSGRNFHYGVREFSMGAIVNGLTLHQGLTAFGSTFMVFSDYMKPALRLAALMKIPSLFIFTHDSIAVGEDGPTHEPIEQLLMLRSIPNFHVFRPADINETIGSYITALGTKKSPSAIVATRQDLPQLANSNILAVSKGAYVISKEKTNLDLVLIATGSEVHLAIEAQVMLESQGIGTRVVSMPSTNLFDNQEKSYQLEVLPKDIVRVVIELGVKDGWYKYVGLDGLVIGLDNFGASGEMNSILTKYGFTSKIITDKIMTFLKQRRN